MKCILRLRILVSVILFLLFTITVTFSQEIQTIQHPTSGELIKLYPETLDTSPRIPSPFKSENGIEVVIAVTKDKKYTLIPVTVENGEPMNYNKDQWGKGNQREIDEKDFPALAKTGLHSEIELDQTKTITERSIEEITETGRPEKSSIAGFMSYDEDIISVLKGDNRLVKKLGLTHPQLAKPLFNIFCLILENLKYTKKKIRPYIDIDYILYNGRTIYLEYRGSKGWQDSIFNDEILGYWRINIRKEMNENEISFLNRKYSHLNAEQMSELIEKLSHIHTGEMVPYYIKRYGFYEGHTDYRADPIAISFIFGLKSLEEIEAVFKGNLYSALTDHFTSKSISQNTQVYKHPSLGFRFKASENWVRVPRPEDKLIYEMMSPDSIIHVMLWYTETEQEGSSYLGKMANIKDLIVNDKPSHRQINNLDAWVRIFRDMRGMFQSVRF